MKKIRQAWRRFRFRILKWMLTEEERRVIYGMRLGFKIELKEGEDNA